ncbi:MAG: saccharopine dehydrogenase C-terminal domain-containing protein [Acidobacteriota bacterium]|nr:saccharopine dehydrogenase C-terminal domain-containing protein [Acidobacteriota bacterium]
MKKALVLGAGLVVKPLLDELSQRPDTEVQVAALNIERAEELVAQRPHASAMELDISDRAALQKAVNDAAVVISLLPADCHVAVAECCLEARVPLVTSSYVSDGMRALHSQARERGVLLLNETGLDPGIDHMMAMEVIRRVRGEGGEILGFTSYCGGLPAPEANDNPFGYKLSWSPRGVLLSARSSVRYLQDGKVVEHPHPYYPDALRSAQVPGIGELEVYPTRDSLKYREPYHLEEVPDLFRGTFRYPGWARTLIALLELDLLDLEERDHAGATYGEWLAHRLGLEGGTGSGEEQLAGALAERLEKSAGEAPSEASSPLQAISAQEVAQRFRWLGLLSSQPLPAQYGAPLDLVAHLLQQRMQYAPGERDMVVLEHHFLTVNAAGRNEQVTKRLVAYGTAGDDSAMARTVGTPAGLASGLILDDRISLTGVHIPVSEQLADPILEALAQRGLEIEEHVTPVD